MRAGFSFALVFGVLCKGLLFSPATIADDKKPMQLEDVFSIEYASDPQITSDLKNVVFVRNYMDIQSDKRRSNLWRVSTDGQVLRPLTTGLHNDRMPRISPDGKRMAFVSNREGSSQIYMYWFDTGTYAPISQLSSSPSNISWSPDGKRLAFTAFVPGKKAPVVSLPGKPKGAKWAEPATLINSTFYRFDGAGYLPEGDKQIFVISADGGVAQQVTSAEYSHDGPLNFSQDGESLYFSANISPETTPQNSELFELKLASGEVEKLTERFGPDSQPIISPNGRWLAYIGYDDKKVIYQNRMLYLYDLKDKRTLVLTGELDRSVSSPKWAGNSKHVYFKYDDMGDTRIARVDMRGRISDVASGAGGLSIGRPYSAGDFDIEGNLLAFTQTNGKQPSEVALVNYRGGKVSKLTQLNQSWTEHRALSDIQEIRYPSSAGELEIQGWVAFPPGFDESKKYPLLLEIHGGPVANYGPRFAAEMQLFAAKGYVVVYINPRGSDSYGEAFANEIHHNYPSQDYDDLMSGVDYLLDKGYIDENRMFVTGGSGGGTLTAWIIGHTDRFRAAVVAKPVINWYSFSLTADAYPFFTQYWFEAMPWETPESYMKRSPISYVGNVKTPTMLLTGEADYRTPMSETEQYYQALKLAGVETAMVRIPGAGHGIAARPSNLMSKVAHILWWFEQYDIVNENQATESAD
ncbi:S9 family peptidase [Corallincola platygyrae]|uniref:S9 family peptidase n=1 Tax=Corallincola platygyrae TaxID=1193278 RepID=A0ABW4XLA0_9GAMM